jgi:hypothetical protein
MIIKLLKTKEYILGDWCYVLIKLYKNMANGKYEVKLFARNDLLKERLKWEANYEELKYATICYDNWKNIFIDTPKELEEEMGEPKLKKQYIETYKAL